MDTTDPDLPVAIPDTTVAFSWDDGRSVSTTTGFDGRFQLVLEGTGSGEVIVWLPSFGGLTPFAVSRLEVTESRTVDLGDLNFRRI